MKKESALPSYERVIDLLDYDPVTGGFTWKGKRIGVRSITAGYKRKDGYLIITIDYCRILAHRLAIFIMTKDWPEYIVDHIDGNPSNNSFSNIRPLKQQHNIQNIRRATKRNKSSGILGVSYHARDDLWRARIHCDGKNRCWYFKNKEDAERKYLEEKRKSHLGCTI